MQATGKTSNKPCLLLNLHNKLRIKHFFLFLSLIFFFFPIQNVFAYEDRLFIIDDDIGMDRVGVGKTGSYWMPWLKITDPDGGLELIYALG